jgi:hypothetical protein
MLRFSVSRILFSVTAALAVAATLGCGSTPSVTGSIRVALTMPDGTTLPSMTYQVVASDGMTVLTSGKIGTIDPLAAPSIAITLPDSNGTLDVMSLAGMTSAGLSCTGVTPGFAIASGKTTHAVVMIVCGGSAAKTMQGSLDVNATVSIGDNCPVPAFWEVAPLQVAVGGHLQAKAIAVDADAQDVLTYTWTATIGSFVAPSSAMTEYVCATPGAAVLSVVVSDNHGSPTCTASQSFNVDCGP